MQNHILIIITVFLPYDFPVCWGFLLLFWIDSTRIIVYVICLCINFCLCLGVCYFILCRKFGVWFQSMFRYMCVSISVLISTRKKFGDSCRTLYGLEYIASQGFLTWSRHCYMSTICQGYKVCEYNVISKVDQQCSDISFFVVSL